MLRGIKDKVAGAGPLSLEQLEASVGRGQILMRRGGGHSEAEGSGCPSITQQPGDLWSSYGWQSTECRVCVCLTMVSWVAHEVGLGGHS